MLNLKCQFWYLPQRTSLAHIGSHIWVRGWGEGRQLRKRVKGLWLAFVGTYGQEGFQRLFKSWRGSECMHLGGTCKHGRKNSMGWGSVLGCLHAEECMHTRPTTSTRSKFSDDRYKFGLWHLGELRNFCTAEFVAYIVNPNAQEVCPWCWEGGGRRKGQSKKRQSRKVLLPGPYSQGLRLAFVCAVEACRHLWGPFTNTYLLRRPNAKRKIIAKICRPPFRPQNIKKFRPSVFVMKIRHTSE